MMLWAGQNASVGRIQPTGHMLQTPGLVGKSVGLALLMVMLCRRSEVQIPAMAL